MNNQLVPQKLDAAEDIQLLVAGDIVPFTGNHYPLLEEVRQFRVYGNEADVIYLIGRKDSSTITRLGFRTSSLALDARKALTPTIQPFLMEDYSPSDREQTKVRIYNWLNKEFLKEVGL
mgnify:CR=1 FL=1